MDEIAEGARWMLAATHEAELDAYVSGLVEEVDEAGRRLVVRNGHAELCSIQTGAGAVEVERRRLKGIMRRGSRRVGTRRLRVGG